MPTRLMPCSTDLYFTAEDAIADARHMVGAGVQVLRSDWGHVAGGAGRDATSHQQVLLAAQSLLAQQGR